jgi:hypothetical protein
MRSGSVPSIYCQTNFRIEVSALLALDNKMADGLDRFRIRALKQI